MRPKLKLLLLLVLPLFLYGCTTGPTSTPTPSPTTVAEQVVLHWWGVFETIEDVQPLIDKYKSENSNIKDIQYVQKPLNGDESAYRTMIDSFIADKEQTPDIFLIQNTWAGKYSSLITPAPNNIIDEAYFADFYNVVKKDFYRSGTIALPQYMDAIAIIYDENKLIAEGFSKPSAQWSDFKVMAQRLTKKGTGNTLSQAGFSAGYYENVQFRFDLINLLMLVNAVKMTDIQELSATFYTPENMEDTERAIEFYKSLGTTAWSKEMKKDIAEFLEGRLAMYAAPSWRLIDILNYKKQFNLNLTVAVAEVPQLSNYSAYWASYWGYTVSKNSPNSTESWKFIKFLNEKASLELLDKTVKENGRPIGIIFPRKSMNIQLANDKYLGPYIAALDKAETWYMYDGFKMKNAFNSVLSKLSGFDGLSSLQSTATAIMKGTQ